MTSAAADKELLYTPAHQLISMMKARQLSPVELMEATLRRIENINPQISAYITVDEEGAMHAAEKAAEDIAHGVNLGLLHGLPVSVKDTIDTEGLRTTSGSTVFNDFVPDADDPAVQRLKEAGAIVVGKTNVPEFANAFSAENSLTDPCRNPWDPDISCSGSSSGAAASVAAGIGPIALGTDGGGSIRAPASACGVYGLKPTTTITRIPFAPDSRTGRAFNFATHGPITRNVKDAALAMNALSGPYTNMYNCIRSPAPDFVDAIERETAVLRIAWSADLGYVDRDYGMDMEHLSVVEDAVSVFKELGHNVQTDHLSIGNPIRTWEAIVASQVQTLIGPIYDQHYDELMIYNRHLVEYARSLSGSEVANAFLDMQKWRVEMDSFFEKYDLLLSPCLNSSPQPIGAIFAQPYPSYYNFFQWEYCPCTPLFNLTGNPAASIPCGFTANGLPVGLHIAGRPGDEATVLQASAAFERARPWAGALPRIC